jgi:CHAT domain-containing protein/tetratricopeptide (TPR) repeat protein
LTLGSCNKVRTPPPAETYQAASLNLERGNWQTALHQADAELAAYPDLNSEWNWKFRTLKAEILVRQRLNNEALALLQPEPPTSLAATDIPVRRRMTQGSAYGFLSQFSDADKSLDEAEALATKYAPNLLGEIALRKGTLCFLRDDSAQAETYYRNALAAARSQNQSFLEASSLGSLGLIAAQQEHYDQSIDWDNQALKLSQSIGAQASATKTLGNIAWSYFQLGDYQNSLALYQQAEQSAARQGNIGDELTWLVNLSSVDFYLHDYASADRDGKTALELARRLGEKPQIAATLDALARVALAQGNIDAAGRYAGESVRLFRESEDHIDELSSTITEARIQNALKNRPQAINLLNGVIASPAATGSVRWEAQARLAGVYVDDRQYSAAQDEFRQAVSTVESARSSVRDEQLRISFLANAADLYDDYVDFLVSRNRVEEALRVAALARSKTLLEGLGLLRARDAGLSPNLDLHQIARQARATILIFWLGANQSYLWTITPSGTIKLFQLPAENQIHSAVHGYLSDLLGPRDVPAAANSNGANLYATLLAPARSVIAKNSRVIIVPDGSLCSLNFEALIAPDPAPHYWIDDVTISYADSLLMLHRPGERRSFASGKMLVVGDPVPATSEFPRLPQANTEIASVEKYFRPTETKILSGHDATPGAYLESKPEQFAFIHFVAHGVSSNARPFESAVVLTQQGDSYKLYGRDVMKHRLNAELVTVSACHGVGTRNYSEEGLVGLSWAFLRAGAHGVIAALWDVNDASTAQLMDRFYGEMSKGKDVATALRDAKLALLHSGTVYQRPFYWAPFQFYTGM